MENKEIEDKKYPFIVEVPEYLRSYPGDNLKRWVETEHVHWVDLEGNKATAIGREMNDQEKIEWDDYMDIMNKIKK